MKSNQTKSIGLRTGILITLALLAIQGLAQSSYEPYTFSTLAGGGGYSTNGAGSAARFWFSAAVAVDGAGNVYVVENVNNTLSKVTPAGVITTLAGKAGSVGSVDGTGSAARFSPEQLAVDGAGNFNKSPQNSTFPSRLSSNQMATRTSSAGAGKQTPAWPCTGPMAGLNALKP